MRPAASVFDEEGLSSTQPGRALRWVDPEVPSTSAEAAARAAEILATLPPFEHLEQWRKNLQPTIEEEEEMLGPVGSLDEIEHALFALRNDWRISTRGRRLPKILKEHI